MGNGDGMSPPVFVVSTGRCGSTMISDMVRKHPTMLSVSEFLATMGATVLRGGKVSGEDVFRKLNTCRPALRTVLRNHLQPHEFLYPMDSPDARYGPEDLPSILAVTLPHLTDDHDDLWDELGQVLRRRERAALQDHYRFTFEWLADRYDKTVWIERSGASLLLTPLVARRFPDARFVHVFRDGRDTAMSMQKHGTFRSLAMLASQLRKKGLDPFSRFNWPGTSPWIYFLLKRRAKRFSAEKFRAAQIDLPTFGWLWSGMIARGVRHLEALPPDRVLSLRFESILSSPEHEMTRFAEFVGPGYVDAAWLKRICGTIRDKPPSWPRLPPAELALLNETCQPGMRLLGYDNSRWRCGGTAADTNALKGATP